MFNLYPRKRGKIGENLAHPGLSMKKPIFLNQVAIVTGASSGIGRATALALARQGANLALAARNIELLTTLAAEISSLGREVLVVPTDVTRQEQVSSMVEAVIGRWSRIDILVSNAGQYIRAPISILNLSDLEQSMAVNFYGGVYAVQAVLPHMLAHTSGHIVFISSLDGKFALPGDAPYVAAKFALTGFSAALRQEMIGKGISVTTVLPGRVDTPMIQNLHVPWISAKIPPQVVANGIVRAIRRRQAEVILPFHGGLLYYISVFTPGLSDWLTRLFHLQGWNI
jgi:NADP-dependent 3-hydroxy acid dehydrogenase YdfG